MSYFMPISFYQFCRFVGLSLLLINCQTTEVQKKKPHNQIDSSKANPVKTSIIAKKSSSKDTVKMKYPSIDLANKSGKLSIILQKMAKGDSVKIVCYGNSITRGYKVGSYGTVDNPYPKVLEKLWQDFYKNPHIKVINEGHNGWRSDQGLINLADLVLSKKPDLVILEFGINDAYSNFTVSIFENKMQSIVNEIVTHNSQVLLLTPTPILSSYNQKVMEYCQVLEKIAQKSNITFLNIHQIISQRAENEQVTKKKFLPDEVHFADDKYAWIAEAIFEFSKNLK